jgi:hypothetical protein
MDWSEAVKEDDICLGSLVGDKMAWFLPRCETSHPELQKEPLAGCIREALEFEEVARFCFQKGISAPLRLMRTFPSTKWPTEIFRARFLKEPYRSVVRSRKKPFSLASPSFIYRLSSQIADLPSDFEHLKNLDVLYAKTWLSNGRLLKSVGCDFLSSRANELSGVTSKKFMGLPSASLVFFGMVLCKRIGAKVAGSPPAQTIVGSDGSSVSISVIPVDFRLAGEVLPVFSDDMVEGHPAFDHHLVVCSPQGEIFLGERDGAFYLIGENYFDCGGEL